jgi:hypothetical protein
MSRTNDLQKAENVISLLRAFLPQDIQPTARVLSSKDKEHLPGSEVGVWDCGSDRKIVAIWRNAQFQYHGLGGVQEFAGETKGQQDPIQQQTDISITLDKTYEVMNQRTGESYGKTYSINTKFSKFEPLILSLQSMPFENQK